MAAAGYIAASPRTPTLGQESAEASKARLETELDEANEYIEELEQRLDDIASIVEGEDDAEDANLDEGESHTEDDNEHLE